MNVLFLCGIYPQKNKDEIFYNSKRGYQFAAQNLQDAIVIGFIENRVSVDIITVPFISTFPLGYKRPIIDFGSSQYYDIIDVKCSRFINIPFLRERTSSHFKDVIDWSERQDSSKVKHIIVYSLNVGLMKAALKAKEENNEIQISIIVPDLPQFMGSNYFYKVLGQKDRDIEYIYKNIHLFDNFILLTEAMKVSLNINRRSCCVMEGILNKQSLEIKRFNFSEKVKTILYTGALSKKYGIDTLLSAFNSLIEVDYRLIICGQGEAEKLVKSYCKIDKRITFLGKMSHEVILTMQKGADLLINPRTNEGEYTKYSFPSKTMEYFASGTPVLLYKLKGIPPNYFDYCYTLDIETEEALANKIKHILLLPEEERIGVGRRAAKFIFEEKNAKKQVGKIIELLRKE